MSFDEYNRNKDKRISPKTSMTKQIIEGFHEEVDFIKANARFGAVHVCTSERSESDLCRRLSRWDRV